MFAGLREGKAPGRPSVLPKSWQVLAFRQLVQYKRVPYSGVVLSTPQEGPHGRAAIRAALPQGEKLDRRPRPPIAEEPPKPAEPSKTCGQTSRGGRGGRNADLPFKFTLVGGV